MLTCGRAIFALSLEHLQKIVKQSGTVRAIMMRANLRRWSSTTRVRLLVVDGYDATGRVRLESVGATPAHELFNRLLRASAASDPVLASHGVDITAVHPAIRPQDLPGPAELARDFDGIAWTGANLTIHNQADPLVQRQIAFARDCYASGTPQVCWESWHHLSCHCDLLVLRHP